MSAFARIVARKNGKLKEEKMKVAQALYEFTRVYRNEEKIEVQLSVSQMLRAL